MPRWLEQRIFGVLLRLLNGDVSRFGLPRPDHRIFETHPILNTQVLHFLAHGDLEAMPDVERFAGRTVHFKDWRTEEIDLVLCATGYDWGIPYVPEDQFRWKGHRPDLYLAMFSRENPRLYVMGFLETNNGAYRMFDDMADLIARAIVARAEGRRGGAGGRRDDHRRPPDLTGGIHFIATDRHATYVDGPAYRKALRPPAPAPRLARARPRLLPAAPDERARRSGCLMAVSAPEARSRPGLYRSATAGRDGVPRAMPSLPLLLVDAFTEHPFAGNACAVVLDAGALSRELMQRIAREMNQSETAFVLGGKRTRFDVRYYTPGEEIPLAGHPTIATTAALADAGRLLPTGPRTEVTFALRTAPSPSATRSARPGCPRGDDASDVPSSGRCSTGQRPRPSSGSTHRSSGPDAPVQVVSTGLRS
jgi:hypothetical protein